MIYPFQDDHDHDHDIDIDIDIGRVLNDYQLEEDNSVMPALLDEEAVFQDGDVGE